MSLRVWLPLNGTLDNQGLDNVTVINNGATIDNNGKIGKCYSFDGSDDYISLTGNCLYNIIKGGTNSFSISFWIYQADSTRAIIFGDYSLAGGIGFNIELTAGHVVRFYWNGSPDLNISQINVGTTIWNHVVLVYDTTHIYGYLNGNLVYTYTGTLTVKNKTSGSYYLGRDSRTGSTALNGRLNDFRIYDHALSPLEVKQISQGLILHYSLNRNGWGQENLIANSNVEKSGKGSNLILYDLTTTGVSTVLGKTMRISADIKSDTTNSILDCYVRSSTSQSMCSNTIFTNIGTDYKRYSTTTICNTNQSSTPQWFAFRSNGANGTTSTATFTIKNVKLEIGENTTPWSPASADTLATTMGLNDSVEYDTSGYGNNGTKMGTFSWISNTPKYNVSTEFNTNNYIIIDPLTINMDNVSFAIWVKWDVFNSYSRIWDFGQVASGGGYCCFLMNDATNGSIKLRLRNASGTELLNDNFITANINTWYHIVFTLSNTTYKVYVNGVLKNTKTLSSNIGTAIFNYPYIGKSNWSTDALLDGKLSDFRIYATALSADDVKSLYNNSAYIDNQGNIYGAVYEEV